MGSKTLAMAHTHTDYSSLVASLKACTIHKDLHKGTIIHGNLLKLGLLRRTPILGSTLIAMYARCGALDQAKKVLEELPVRNVKAWNALISAYTHHGYGKDALKCFEMMQDEGISPDAFTFGSILKACGMIGSIKKGEEIHQEVLHKGLLQKDVVLGTILVDMYARCGKLEKAEKVLEDLIIRDVISWNTLISRYAQQGQGESALKCFEKMQREQVSPDNVTFISIVKACGTLRELEKGKQIHDEIIRNGFKLEKDVVLGTAIVDMYAKCGALARAREVFEKLLVRNIISWNALICGYAQQGQCEEALRSFEQMKSEGLSPNAITFTCILKACGSTRAFEKGMVIHDEVVRKGLLEKDVEVGNSLVDMYAKCGASEKAHRVLLDLPSQNIVSWNALISGYTQQGQDEEALHCFQQIVKAGLTPNAITFTCILKACGSMGDIHKGEIIRNEIIRKGLLEKDGILGTALVDMYARCGMISKAQQVHDELCLRDVVSWSSLISGYADQGLGEQALNCFQEMQEEGFSPTAFSLVCVLNACSHSGLVDEGEMVYFNMSTGYGVMQSLEHHTCMVDLYGRSGQLEKAVVIIKKLPASDHYPPIMGALLGACQKWWDVGLGKLAFVQAIQLDTNNTAAYACMANIYTGSGFHEDTENSLSCQII